MQKLWSRLSSRFGFGAGHAPTAGATPPIPARPPAPSQPVDAGLENFVLKMPKVELHVHLEGSLRPASLLSLAKDNGVNLPAGDEAGVRRWLRFRDFPHFVEIYQACGRCLRKPEDFRIPVRDLMAEQAIQNVVYSEAHFTIASHAANGVDPKAIHQVLSEAIAEEEKHHGVRLRLIPDIVRDEGETTADLTLKWATAGLETGLTVALGLTGSETLANAPFKRHFEEARRRGLHTTAHAGENGGPDSIRSVLDDLGVERIDHGVRAVEEEAWLPELARRGVGLTVCPTSNVVLGVAPDYDSHPFDRLRRSGLGLSVNTDGSQMFGTNLTREYLHLHRLFGYGAEDLACLSLGGLDQAFLSDEEKGRLSKEFRAQFKRLGQRYLGRPVEP